MTRLEPIHEKAIDLFVAGKKQHEIAAELNVNPRTLRRWSDSELFVRELHTPHAQARKLEQDAAAEYQRQRAAFHQLILKRIETLLNDPTTPPHLIAVCLKLGMQDMQAAQRQADAQTWREHVYEERKAESLAAQQTRATIKNASSKLDASANLLEHLLSGAGKADESGHTPKAPDVPSDSGEKNSEAEIREAHEKADKSGHPPAPPVVKPVQPFRYPRPEKKPAPATAQSEQK